MSLLQKAQKELGNSRLLWIGGAFLFLYILYLLFAFRVTISSVMSLAIAILVLLSLVSLWYYLAYRWGNPDWAKTILHQRLMQWVSAIMLGLAGSIWLAQNQTIPARVLQAIDSVIPLLHGNPVADYQSYYPLVTLLFITLVIAMAAMIAFIIVLRKRNSTALVKNTQRLLTVAYALMLISVSGCVFSTDALELGPGQKSVIFYGGTETYVTDRLSDDSLSFVQDLQKYGGFMFGAGPDGSFQVYMSSTGFYSSVLKLVQSVTKINPDDFIKGCRLLFALILAGMLTAFSLTLKKKFGLLVSLIFSAFPVITYWFIGPAGYLIWFYFLLFIPFFLSIYFYPRVLRGRWTFRRFLWIVFIGEAFLYLRGYTYLPGLILSAAIPVFFYDLQTKKSIKELFIHGFMVCLAGLAGFLFVILLHFVQIWFYVGNPAQAFAYLRDRAITRSSAGDTNLQTPAMIFFNWLGVRVFYLSKRFFAIFPQWQAPFEHLNNFANLHWMAFISAGIAFVLKGMQKLKVIRGTQKQKEVETLFNLGLTTLLAMLASWTWFPALGHMAHHYHMNGIMYMVPFGLTLFILMGFLIQTLLHWLVEAEKTE